METYQSGAAVGWTTANAVREGGVTIWQYTDAESDVRVDRAGAPMSGLPEWPAPGRPFTAPTERQDRAPRAGRLDRREVPTLVVVQAHADDLAFLGAGTVARMVREGGYDAYLVQTTNDDKCGPTASVGETVLANERETEAVASLLGIRRTFNLGYVNHFLDTVSVAELRARLVFLFRLLRPDVVMTFNPAHPAEQNPDHWVTGQAVEAARWMAGLDKDYPEHLAAGLAPHVVRGRMYWVARAGQAMNRVVDVSDYLETKVEALAAHQAQGTAGSTGRRLRATLAAQGRHIPALGHDDESADRTYVRRFMLAPGADLGARYGMACAEPFLYLDDADADAHEASVAAWVEANAVPTVAPEGGSTILGFHDDHDGDGGPNRIHL
jgi:LmbE family N-acetylglucosaminyl deacetylase